MTLHDFKHWSFARQLAQVLVNGLYLARRWDNCRQAAHLYRLASGLFVELHCDVDENVSTHAFAFAAGTEDDRLEDYAVFVRLPDGLPETQ